MLEWFGDRGPRITPHVAFWWGKEWRPLLRPLIPLIIFLLACVFASITFSAAPVSCSGIFHRGEGHVILPIAEKIFARLCNRLCNIVRGIFGRARLEECYAA